MFRKMRRFKQLLPNETAEGIPAEIDSSIKNMAIIEMDIEHMTAKEAIELGNMKK